MSARLRAEAQKFATTRSSVAIAAAGVAYGAIAVGAVALAPAAERPAIDGDTILQIIRGVADLAVPAAVVLAIVGTAGEHRHGTIVPTLLATPHRRRLLAAKLAWHALLGAAIGLAGTAVAVGAGALYLRSQGTDLGAPTDDILLTALGAVVVTTAYAAIAAAFGSVVCNQTAAISTALAWMLAVENIVPLVVHKPGLRRWLLDGSADRVLHLAHPGPGMAPAWVAAGSFAVVFVALALMAAIRLDRTDIP